MAIFNSYVGLPEGIYLSWSPHEELRLPQTGDFRNDLFRLDLIMLAPQLPGFR